MAQVFGNGDGILVTTHGPGNLHLYTYGAINGWPGIYGSVSTPRRSVSHFIISHSYNFTKYAFYWDGEGKAECTIRVSSDPKTYPVTGKSWGESSWVKWGDTEVSTLDVSPDYFAGAGDVKQFITCFLIPERLLHGSS
ncbi:hypothetical protein JB92DRAFT_3019892 [Gautieria morchelliformis]|nr:hypothetical protein JB92DRAFT_3019892 [Gautieria morchelliformis]